MSSYYRNPTVYDIGTLDPLGFRVWDSGFLGAALNISTGSCEGESVPSQNPVQWLSIGVIGTCSGLKGSIDAFRG